MLRSRSGWATEAVLRSAATTLSEKAGAGTPVKIVKPQTDSQNISGPGLTEPFSRYPAGWSLGWVRVTVPHNFRNRNGAPEL